MYNDTGDVFTISKKIPSIEELEYILREHAHRYSKMQPTDAVKLIYQNEFGGGHLIPDEAACLEYLHREYAMVKKDPAAPRFEEIGNGMIRVNLAALQESDLEKLGQDFIRSASVHKGSRDVFLGKLEVLKRMTKQGIFSFGFAELDTYLAAYERMGYVPVSHSQVYRDTYRPAYRVIRLIDD